MNDFLTENAMILAVDDDKVTRRMLESVLQRNGYRVKVSPGFKDALSIFKSTRLDLVVTDMDMPDGNGLDLCKELRKDRNDLDLPIIVLTGSRDIDAVRAAFDAGATDFISKPINWDILLQRLRFALRDKLLYRNLEENRLRLEIAQRIAKVGYWTWKPEDARIHLSDHAMEVLGFDDTDSFSLNEFMRNIHQEDRDIFFEHFCRSIDSRTDTSIVFRINTGANEILIRQIIRANIQNGVFYGLDGVLQNITDEKNKEKSMEYHHHFDYLTELPNRNSLKQHVFSIVSDSAKSKTTIALVMLAIRNFKNINDAYGQEQGDVLLYLFARRLVDNLPNNHYSARVGADTFGVAIGGLKDAEDAQNRVEDVMKLLNQPFEYGGKPREVDICAGIAVYPRETVSADTLYDGAESALLSAKAQGPKVYNYFTKEMDAALKKRLTIEESLRGAILKKDFQVFYQPQIDLKSGNMVGVEALARWMHPDLGMIPPATFIPIAEKSGLIIPIGEQIFEIVLRDLHEWKAAGREPFIAGINLSPRQFNDPKLVEKIDALIKKYAIPPANLDLEITESMAMEDFQTASRLLTHFRKRGLRTSMDDFGTGYSSLSYLTKLPLDTLKVDRSFIKDIGPNGENGEIARAVIMMAHSLSLKVIAEGAENENHIRFLSAQACDIVQGFYYSAPISLESLLQFRPPAAVSRLQIQRV